MAKHISLRLAWHSDGWNGKICKKPCDNTYCVGMASYPKEAIRLNRDLAKETLHAGKYCADINYIPPCCRSINAFGDKSCKALIEPPKWMAGKAKPITIEIPPASACTWNFEGMYSDDVIQTSGSQKYDNNQRYENAENYFSELQEDKSLIFYYANYSNPFSEEENQKYVVVGVSRLKEIGDFQYFSDVSQDIKDKYAGGLAWEKVIASHYPEQGFKLPYKKHIGNDEIIESILVCPENNQVFKYGTREISDDDAIQLVNKLLASVKKLKEINDQTENWIIREEWLNTLLGELWLSRGAYPGMPTVLEYLGLNASIEKWTKYCVQNKSVEFYNELVKVIDGHSKELGGAQVYEVTTLRKIGLMEDDEKELLKLLTRFNLSHHSKFNLAEILLLKRQEHGIDATCEEICKNPYIISEQYQGESVDDRISIYTIENGVLPSPQLGIQHLFGKDCPERFRAFCVNELKGMAAHSFASCDEVLKKVNARLENMPEYKRHAYVMKNFTLNTDVLIINQALFIRECQNEEGKNATMLI